MTDGPLYNCGRVIAITRANAGANGPGGAYVILATSSSLSSEDGSSTMVVDIEYTKLGPEIPG